MNRSFPALRGIAIILVVINHTITMGSSYALEFGVLPPSGWLKAALSTLAGLGIFAVPIFLFLSGCFFAYAANRDDLGRNYRIVKANLLHVLLPYLIWSCIFYIEIYLVRDQRLTATEYLKSLLVGYPFHFVPLLAFYYLVSPILIRATRYIGDWTIVLLVGVFQLFLLNITHPGILGFEFPAWANRLAPPVIASTLAEWAIFFPLGLIYVKTSKRVLPNLQKARWISFILTVILYALALLDVLYILEAPLARYLCPVAFMLITPTFQRNAIPLVRPLELIGKKAYGLYLMNLLVLDLILFSIQSLLPGLLAYYLLLLPILALATLAIPMLLMRSVERLAKPVVHRYVFG
jgi:peptidoglycan/LPS O-acetylase OafA/YrhL